MRILTKATLVASTIAATTIGASLPATAEATTPATADNEIAILAGSSTQSRNGLTCNNQWFNTLGKTNCTGNNSQEWRLKLTCQFQGDIYGTWQQGPGSDQNECTFRVTGASVQWR
jgi:hypothetical protein